MIKCIEGGANEVFILFENYFEKLIKKRIILILRRSKKMHTRTKKRIATICIGATVLTLVPAVSWAETAEIPLNNQQVSPYMLYIYDAISKLSISGTTATVNASVTGYANEATKAKVVAELQVKNGSSWLTVKTWTVTENDYEAVVDETYTITKGKTYRVKATMTVWEGSQSETQTFYSE